jgi:hypothetical protein
MIRADASIGKGMQSGASVASASQVELALVVAARIGAGEGHMGKMNWYVIRSRSISKKQLTMILLG